MKSILILLGAIGANACVRDLSPSTLRHRHVKRQAHDTALAAPDANEKILLESFDATSIDTWSYYYTHGDHVAGRNKTMAQWTADRWAEYGFTSRLDEYYVYLNYPVKQSLSLTYANGSAVPISLEEEVLEEDDTTSYPNRIPVHHGYSFSGDATAEYVYVGRGQQVDFDRLEALGVPLEGKIAVARYGGPFRGLKVKNAQDHGMIGAVIFSDPGDDGNVTVANGVAAYPDGPARNPTSVQRGSVMFLSTYPGDPETPGYPSKEGVPRADRSNVTPQIPSIPISYSAAQPILAALNGFGTEGTAVNRTAWVGAIPGVDYYTGEGSGAKLALSNLMEDNHTAIWNAIGVINGTNQDEVIIVGNHRDAWIIGGGADPNSGSAVLIELAKAFSKLCATGWKPERTIVLASWDAEEYGLVGSTEWMEEYIPWLSQSAVSYLNIDVAVSGPIPDFSATPDFHNIAAEVMKKVIWPYRGTTNRTLYDVWMEERGEFGVLGSGSDYTAFLHRGISSIDMGAGGGPNDPIYPYHSNYDSYNWMTQFGDPGFEHHKAMGQYLSLLLYHLASDPVIPLNPEIYVTEMKTYLSDLEAVIAEASGALDLSLLTSAIDTFQSYAEQFVALRDYALRTGDTTVMAQQNKKARDFSRGFTSQGGLPGREFYRHLIFAPGLDTGYAPVTFPAISEAITFDKDWEKAQTWVKKTADAIVSAAEKLRT